MNIYYNFPLKKIKRRDIHVKIHEVQSFVNEIIQFKNLIGCVFQFRFFLNPHHL